jgi:hypothetical protein
LPKPLPLDPGDPDVVVLHEHLAGLLLKLYKERAKISPPSFPEISGWTWGERSFPLEGVELGFGEEGLRLVLNGFHWRDLPGFRESLRDPNKSAAIAFADGTQLIARFASWTSEKTTMSANGSSEFHVVELDCWTWQPSRRPHLWVGNLRGRKLRAKNVCVHSEGTSGWGALRVESSYDLHIVNARSGDLFFVVDTRDQALDQEKLANDFQALEFALGCSLGLDVMIAVDDRSEVVGAADLGLEQELSLRPHRCPVPGEAPRHDGCWIPALATRVARGLLESRREDSPLLIATTAYRDSLAGHVHRRYLLAQVALEAVARKLYPGGPKHLADDLKPWRTFLDEHDATIRGFARDKTAADKLISNLRDNALRSPSGDRVLAALNQYGLDIPEEARKELGRRNWVAHDFVMFRDEDPDPNELAKRIAIVQTLLVALVAKHVDYRGPILGWELSPSRAAGVPSWWAHEDSPEAHRRYFATVSLG